MKIPRQICIAVLIAAGCSDRPKAIATPDVDPEGAAASAIEEFDRDSDGRLAKDELSAAPMLASVVPQYDKNGDGALDADEIASGIGTWEETGVAVRPVPFMVTLNGRPLSGATIRFVPAGFLNDAIKGATGETGPGGGGHLAIAREDLPPNSPNMPLVQPGFYRVEITHPKAKIPAKYNTQSTLGIEITSGNPGPEGAKWALETK